MRVTVKKWGNSASVRIPAAIMDAAKLRLNQVVGSYGRLRTVLELGLIASSKAVLLSLLRSPRAL